MVIILSWLYFAVWVLLGFVLFFGALYLSVGIRLGIVTILLKTYFYKILEILTKTFEKSKISV